MLQWAMQTSTAHEAARKAGKTIVELDPPELLPGLGGWYEDFLELSTNRQIGMAAGEIPAWCLDAHVSGWGYEDADAFRACMRAMDAVYLGRSTADPIVEAKPTDARDAFRAAFGRR